MKINAEETKISGKNTKSSKKAAQTMISSSDLPDKSKQNITVEGEVVATNIVTSSKKVRKSSQKSDQIEAGALSKVIASPMRSVTESISEARKGKKEKTKKKNIKGEKVKSDSISSENNELSNKKLEQRSKFKDISFLMNDHEETGKVMKTKMFLPWVDKYKPSSRKDLVGQNGEKSPMNKLLGWLQNWAKNHLGQGGKQKKSNKITTLARPPPWLMQNDGTAFKAVMLSGPPGVGKTTCAVMACKELGLRYVEKNASDVRNKKALEAQTSELIDCEQMDGYINNSSVARKSNSEKTVKFIDHLKSETPEKNLILLIVNTSGEITHVLIMDEVDGMSGNDDRAGIGELIQMIKQTHIPIICICNDRQSQKMRSLVNYCFDVRFQRPRVEQIRARMLTIICQEHLEIKKEEVDEVIEVAEHDVRQSIYNLQLLYAGGTGKELQSKDVALNPFEAARRLLSADTPMWEKQEMFFVDFSLMPLFVQENYPFVQNSKQSIGKRLSALRKAADSISLGDLIDKTIRTTGSWTLLNEQALFSSVAPTTHMNGHMKGMINFPSWLGKNSTFMKHQRLLRQLTTHTYLRTFATVSSMVLDYVPVLRRQYCCPLLEKESDGVHDVINLYKEYNLVKDDMDSIAELAVWPSIKDPGAAISSKIKAALTRTLNKEHILLPYAVDTVMKGRKKAVGGMLL
ncbi:unnamed protein product [Thelazia callipaeda]|uniref:AAA domain-containing protein n=1 Tax=Thelazia callipaeda TaxID=103827 RepID=A0A0N5D918_THECL|nr:unnamed protein product [Thelazia callipaeda]